MNYLIKSNLMKSMILVCMGKTYEKRTDIVCPGLSIRGRIVYCN